MIGLVGLFEAQILTVQTNENHVSHKDSSRKWTRVVPYFSQIKYKMHNASTMWPSLSKYPKKSYPLAIYNIS